MNISRQRVTSECSKLPVVLRRLRPNAVAYLAVACVVTFLLFVPFTAMRQLSTTAVVITQKPRYSTRVLGDAEPWMAFWSSNVVSDLQKVQQLKRSIDHMRYQRLNKDVEYQDTAGLDVMVAASLQGADKGTEVHTTQAWLQSEVTRETFAAINKQQYPRNCSAVKRLYCKLGKQCGFGCGLHHAAHCLSVAVATNRTMILQVVPSSYIRDAGTWNKIFAPLSSCGLANLSYGANDSVSRPTLTAESGLLDTAEEVFVDIIDHGALVVDAPAMPPDVLELVSLFHTRPHIWWQGVLVSWLLRPSQESLQRQLAFRIDQSWTSPIAGVHVRRTDKLDSEAKLHQIAEYMTHVERFCDTRAKSGWQERAKLARNVQPDAAAEAGPLPECSVYLASDNEAVVAEVKQAYSHIHVITSLLGAQTGSVQARYTDEGLLGIYDDILHLAHTDFLVGTFSSQVSRLAYEIAQVNTTSGVTDAAFNYHSVDSQWYFGGQQQYRFCLDHDFTELGVQKLKAGQDLDCPVIYEYDGGYLSCFLPGQSERIKVPPGSLVPFDGGGYRSLLPPQMHRPTKSTGMLIADV